MSTGAVIGLNINKECKGIPIMLKEKVLCRACLNSTEAKLQFVKAYLSLVVEIATIYASKNEKAFSQMVKIGTLAILRAADNFPNSQAVEFDEYARLCICKAMEEHYL